MLKYLIIIFLDCLAFSVTTAQSISSDGRYICNNVDNKHFVIQSTVDSWKKEMPTDSRFRSEPFSSDNKYIFFTGSDNLYRLKLGTAEQTLIDSNVQSSTKYTGLDNEWLAYMCKGSVRELVFLNLSTGKSYRFKNVADYLFNDRSNVLVVKTIEPNPDYGGLTWVNLTNGAMRTIWTGNVRIILNYCFDKQGSQLAFMLQNNGPGQTSNSIWYYKPGVEKAELLADNKSKGIESNLYISNDSNNIFSFSPDGSKLFFSLKKIDTIRPKTTLAQVDVYSYTDAVNQSQQLRALSQTGNQSNHYLAALSMDDHHIIQLQKENEILLGDEAFSRIGGHADFQMNDHFALVCNFKGDVYNDRYNDFGTHVLAEYNWNAATNCNIYLASTRDGTRKLIKEGIKLTTSDIPYFRFSPTGKYVIYYDDAKKNYFSYEVATGIYRNLTENTNTTWFAKDTVSLTGFYAPVSTGSIRWLKDHRAFLVQDSYTDIWAIYPSAQQKPVCITHYFARKNQFIIRSYGADQQDQNIFFRGITRETNNEFLGSISLAARNRFPRLLKGHYSQMYGKKAADADVYLISWESAKQPETTFFSKDFETFKPITSRYTKPRVSVNKEVLTWKGFDGKRTIGILYKPNDFDSRKKYPVIINYYSTNASNVINRFEEASTDTIPRFPRNTTGDFFGVSPNELEYLLKNGYLVFVPDIHYIIGSTGQSVYNSVVPGAKTLAKKPYVDVHKIGICGHSFGGYETNYLVTHTHMFAAAYSGCGVSDFVSFYNYDENDLSGFSPMASCEGGQFGLGTSLWQRPDIYIRNSPIFYADRVTTPLLLMANKGDYRVPYDQGMEFFNALRRLGRRCWLLQYDRGGHFVSDSIDAIDLGTRIIQFFNHYLKGEPAPVWMTRGIPALMKGRENGYAYDTTMKTPGPGLLIDNKAAITPIQKRLFQHKTTTNTDGKIVSEPSLTGNNKKKTDENN
jgi:dipeptidyl aminopeptidase/acylaminoacyl peptidase